jgi:Zn-dependent M28 family amino/carboxypeptidase
VVGAHYDSCYETPAANDNGSGVAATLALARRFSLSGSSLAHRPGQPDRTLRFVFFVNEEPPYFQTDDMGSLVYARACKAKNENIVAMLSLETIGYYRDEPGTQRYPIAPIGWVYPGTGNFISFVGNFSSRDMVRKAIATFRSSAEFPSEGAALPGWISGVGWSDQWAFWQAGYPGVMVTDTAPYRYPHYHRQSDTPDKLDYPRMARVVEGLEAVVWRFASNNDPE